MPCDYKSTVYSKALLREIKEDLGTADTFHGSWAAVVPLCMLRGLLQIMCRIKWLSYLNSNFNMKLKYFSETKKCNPVKSNPSPCPCKGKVAIWQQ